MKCHLRPLGQTCARATLDGLRRLGWELAIDDVGTGHSSLTRLADVPVSSVKVDQWFAQNLWGDASASAVMSAVVTLGERLGYTVIAEGVEKARVADELRSLGVRFVQGFHSAKTHAGG